MVRHRLCLHFLVPVCTEAARVSERESEPGQHRGRIPPRRWAAFIASWSCEPSNWTWRLELGKTLRELAYRQQIVIGSSPTTVPVASTEDGVQFPATDGSANRMDAGVSKQLSGPDTAAVEVPPQSTSENNSSAAEHWKLDPDEQEHSVQLRESATSPNAVRVTG